MDNPVLLYSIPVYLHSLVRPDRTGVGGPNDHDSAIAAEVNAEG